MRHNWKEQDITKVLKKMAKETPHEEVFDRVWFKVEERLESRGRHFWSSITWKPWGHPVRWVAAMACLCVAFVSILNYQRGIDQAEMASYMMSVSNPTENVSKDLGIFKVSTLLSEPSSSSVANLMEDMRVDPMSEGQMLL